MADTYDRLVRTGKTTAEHWTDAERGVWSIVSARSQKDMGGVETVFTDCSIDHDSLVASLRSIDEGQLADAWASAFDVFTRQGALSRGVWTGRALDRDTIEALEVAVGDRMWGLDDKLAAWLSR